jgi:hypothetical protein
MDEVQAAACAKELSDLSRKQSETLQTGTYITISQEEWAAYEKRRERISELCSLLGKFHPAEARFSECTHGQKKSVDAPDVPR